MANNSYQIVLFGELGVKNPNVPAEHEIQLVSECQPDLLLNYNSSSSNESYYVFYDVNTVPFDIFKAINTNNRIYLCLSRKHLEEQVDITVDYLKLLTSCDGILFDKTIEFDVASWLADKLGTTLSLIDSDVYDASSFTKNVIEHIGNTTLYRQNISATIQNGYESESFWKMRHDIRQTVLPVDRVLGNLPASLNKKMHLIQLAKFRGVFDSALLIDACHYSICEIGCGVGRMRESFQHITYHDYLGVDISDDAIELANKKYEYDDNASFNTLEEFQTKTKMFDIMCTVTVLHHLPINLKIQTLQLMYERLNSGGHLMLLEDFVGVRNDKSCSLYPLILQQFIDLIYSNITTNLSLEHIETITYEHSKFTTSALIILKKIA
jgi:SAM-dependent methyltransferase